jgi:hypothetical protein
MAEEDDRCVEELARLFTATRELMDGTAGPIEHRWRSTWSMSNTPNERRDQ